VLREPGAQMQAVAPATKLFAGYWMILEKFAYDFWF
jgi:hypothetical protein